MRRMRWLLPALFLSVTTPTLTIAAQQATSAQRAVLVTGASSGIGRRITETLAKQGLFVYAGARKAEDIAELSRIPNVQGVRLDVTVPSEIAAAVETVRRGGRGLHGVVNNAGVAVVGPLIEIEERELTALFDVNTFGPYRITKAFAPLLIESKGRVVTISSISGILSGPFFGAYSMSKHAVEAFGDALGAEMARYGVTSSLIEPGNYRSEIGRNTMAQVEAALARTAGTPFETQMRGMLTAMGQYDNYPEPDSVAAAAAHALLAPEPRMRYMVVPAARQAEVTIRKAIDELVQLNGGHEFSYDRATLVKMLDEALARVK
ncbi:MAG: SDR family NAD(P)-dependent oxidoreductase [Gemmatimonadetes bacterium]|nr:SDR family NAD(P)-dependent oxidoreductase [Gemmatimonadota bacterium]